MVILGVGSSVAADIVKSLKFVDCKLVRASRLFGERSARDIYNQLVMCHASKRDAILIYYRSSSYQTPTFSFSRGKRVNFTACVSEVHQC